MLADFTITVHEARKPLAVRIKIHESNAALRGACTRYDKRHYDGDEDFTDVLGICHRRHMAGDPVCCVVRLAPPDIGVGMVVHELTHAAVHMWEIQNKFDGTPLVCENDEWFAWVRQTTHMLYKKGVYPR
jgi:hypothetical protein